MSETVILKIVETIKKKMGRQVFISVDATNSKETTVSFWTPGAIHYVYRNLESLIQDTKNQTEEIIVELGAMVMARIVRDDENSAFNRFRIANAMDIQYLFEEIINRTQQLNVPLTFHYYEQTDKTDPHLNIYINEDMEEDADEDIENILFTLYFDPRVKEWYCLEEVEIGDGMREARVSIDNLDDYFEFFTSTLEEYGYDLDELFDD